MKKTKKDRMDEMLDRYDAVVAALPRRQRDVYELCVHQCLTYKEAAKVLGKRPKTAANLLSKALRTVKDRTELGK